MNKKQILTGAANDGEQSFCVGSVEGTSFLAYAAGCDIVIVSLSLKRVQIIPGDELVSCVDSCDDCGRISASYSGCVKIFEPSLLMHRDINALEDDVDEEESVKYQWSCSGCCETTSKVNTLSWDNNGVRLLTGGDLLQLWTAPKKEAWFQEEDGNFDSRNNKINWICIWQCKPSSPIVLARFSADALLFATISLNDRLVKVWYENKRVSPPLVRTDSISPKGGDVHFSFVYVAHPRAVTSFSWRRTSKHMPKGAVANALLTSCIDNICRIWLETVLPDHGLVDVQQLETGNYNSASAFHAHRHRRRLLQRATHAVKEQTEPHTVTPLPSTQSVHDFHKFGIHPNSIAPGLHMHLAAAITPELHIKPAFPSNYLFNVHWLNNKELHFAKHAETIIHEIKQSSLSNDDKSSIGHSPSIQSTITETASMTSHTKSFEPSNAESDVVTTLDNRIENLMREWHENGDMIIGVHPIDGSILIWIVEWLDECAPGSFRQPHVAFSLQIPNALPAPDAASINSRLIILPDYSTTNMKIFSKHDDGSINAWKAFVAEGTRCSHILSVTHQARASGHRFHTLSATSHPLLPLLLTTARYNNITDSQTVVQHKSELILWRVDPVGPLAESGGILELSRVDSPMETAFSHVAWVPKLLPATSLDAHTNSPAAMFVVSDELSLRLYLAVVDARALLYIRSNTDDKQKDLDEFGLIEDDEEKGGVPMNLISKQSTARPGCILELDEIEKGEWNNVALLHVFDSVLINPDNDNGDMYVVLIEKNGTIHMWCIHVVAPEEKNENNFTPDSPLVQDEDSESFSSTPGQYQYSSTPEFNKKCPLLLHRVRVTLTCTKISTTVLSLPNEIDIIDVKVSVGHLSSSSLYIGCKIPYQIVSVSSDLRVRLWRCNNGQNWVEYKTVLDGDSSLQAPSTPLMVCCAYTGRLALAHNVGKHSIAVSIFECESTGGAGWNCEVTLDLGPNRKQKIHLDWVTTEDGSHILTVCVGVHLLVYAAVSAPEFIANLGVGGEGGGRRRQLTKTKSIAVAQKTEDVRWTLIRDVELITADGLAPIPVFLSWVRDGLLVIGFENETHVYSQWKGDNEITVPQPITVIPTSASMMSLSKDKRNKELKKTKPFSLLDVGLFEEARRAHPVLPQYHPKQLLELLNFGRIRRVKAILSHLVTCLSVRVPSFQEGLVRTKSFNRTVSVSGDKKTVDEMQQSENSVEEYTVPPLPIYALLAVDATKSNEKMPLSPSKNNSKINNKQNDSDDNYDTLFNTPCNLEDIDFNDINSDDNDDEDDLFSTSDNQKVKMRKRRLSSVSFSPGAHWGLHQAKQLQKHLIHTRLPGLSSVDQMYLLALADTVATTRADFGSNRMADSAMQDAVDDCGLRFLLAMRHHMYLVKTLPLRQRAPLLRKGLSPSIVVWAFHSEAENELVELAIGNGAKSWVEFRQLGLAWWVRSHSVLRTLIEKLAKNVFEAKRDPLDAALFYLALKKKNILWGLFRSVDDNRMMEFFKNDFKEERWRKAALKNAFALLGRQRFEHAAAFFLLAGAVRDALEVCLNKLDDFQLVLVIARLHDTQLEDGFPKSVKRLLNEELLGGKGDNGLDRDIDLAHPDPFIRSMAYWMLREYPNALSTLLESRVGSARLSKDGGAIDDDEEEASVFNFYNYLRTHPLILRQQLASNDTQLPIGGFGAAPADIGVTPTERCLYFNTAYQHMRSGCPMLALEVLSRLPDVLLVNSNNNKNSSAPETVNSFDWSQPIMSEKTNGLEIQTTATTTKCASDDEMAQQLKMNACIKIMSEELSTLATGFEVDGGHLRVNLYIWLEREADALQFFCNYTSENHLLNENNEIKSNGISPNLVTSVSLNKQRLSKSVNLPTLHEVIIAEKLDLDAKIERMTRRRIWLRANERLLRTLLAFSSLHGAAGGGLASVRMELLLLLQELQQDSKIKQLQHSLPFPTTLPLVSSAVASVKTVVADPIRHLCSTTRDVLKSLLKFQIAPESEARTIRKVLTLRDISAALSASIYQCLCDSDHIKPSSDSIPQNMLPWSTVALNAFLINSSAKRQSRHYSGDDVSPISPPSEWPGVTSLRQLLMKGDKDAPKVRILLLESLVATYLSLLASSLALYDANALYRLVGHPLCATMWPAVFGGGSRKAIRIAVPQSTTTNEKPTGIDKQRTKLHMRILGNPSGLQQQNTDRSTNLLREDKPTYRERYIPPEASMLTYLLTKPYENPHEERINYDSSESVASDDNDDDDSNEFNVEPSKPNTEHSDPNSYSWSLIRFAIVRHVRIHLKRFIPAIGVELAELPIISTLLHAVLRNLETWDNNLHETMNKFKGPPIDYIPSLSVDAATVGPALLKYKAMRDVQNTPFSSQPVCLPVKRLWHFLIRQDCLQDLFIRYLFKKRQVADVSQIDVVSDFPDAKLQDMDEAQMKIVHREQDDIISFCLNQYTGIWAQQMSSEHGGKPNVTNLHCAALATTKEIVELDVSGVLCPPEWLDDNTEYDIETMNQPTAPPGDFVVIPKPPNSSKIPSAPGVFPVPSAMISASVQKDGTNVLCKRSQTGIKKMGAHPNLPYYVSGCNDGAVKLWEWGHRPPLCEIRQSGVFPAVTCCLFNAHGNKLGISDAEGSVSFWQLGIGATITKPYSRIQCHSKTAAGVVWAGSSSVLATCGNGDQKHVAIWDTLLPVKRARVANWSVHDGGATAIAYSPHRQSIISGGRKGDISIIDTRSRRVQHTFVAHEGYAIRSLAIDTAEQLLVTGGSEGDVKIWRLDANRLVHSFTGQHSKASIFRNVSNASHGVSQVVFTPDKHLISCGADGSLKVRKISD